MKEEFDYEIEVICGGVKIIFHRKDLKEIQETSDGVVFSFNNGLSTMLIDPRMQIHTKRLIAESYLRKYQQGSKLRINFQDYVSPVRLEIL